MTGYSQTPLAKKLGYQAGWKVYLKNPPAEYSQLVAPLPQGIHFCQRITNNLDMIHFFSKDKKELIALCQEYFLRIKPQGMIWISWPKKSSKVATDITEDTIREVALPLGLVDVKVCAINDIWSGLKLVIRKQNRA